MRNHWVKCAYCRGQHPTMTELEQCASRVIAWEAAEWRRDHEEMLYQEDLGDQDCAEELGVNYREDRMESEA